ncbi:hypothetical protein Poli38472_012006 [Pythium oligandrum]|uniref:Dynein light chain n=1 Tax=Pythium oligandrum TaxID=41045 RepID=A0A8K1CQJ3_PYTOL|nr:hypothetical protein Poli38472_012006 [Pythium oligandrum]|eukprot:TMW66890.1 hypothetical protein Poli38472_012006 [Pythium oligandrum]
MAPPDKADDGAAPQQTGDDGELKMPKITVLRLEVSTAMKDEAVTHFAEYLQANPNAIEKDISTDMKKYFDQRHGPTWQCIVGKAFGCSVAYDTQFLLFFRADQHYVLLFKSAE